MLTLFSEIKDGGVKPLKPITISEQNQLYEADRLFSNGHVFYPNSCGGAAHSGAVGLPRRCRCSSRRQWSVSWGALDRSGMALAARSICICTRLLGQAQTQRRHLDSGLLEQHPKGICLDSGQVALITPQTIRTSNYSN